jgi:hypothetical protein
VASVRIVTMSASRVWPYREDCTTCHGVRHTQIHTCSRRGSHGRRTYWCVDGRLAFTPIERVADPWLAGMVGWFAFEFIKGNTITRLFFMRLRRLTQIALEAGHVTPELQRARGELVPSFTHFLDLPILFIIIALGTIRPTTGAFSLARSRRLRLQRC